MKFFNNLNGKHAPFSQQSLDFDEDDAFDTIDQSVMEDDEDDEDFDLPKDPKKIMQDLKNNLRKSGMTMTISTSEDKGAA